MKRAAGAGIALLAVACALGRADDDAAKRANAVAPVPSAAPTDRILLVTSTLAGNLEPCHCTEGMLGGLPRRASLVQKFPAGLPLLDLGDLDKPAETSDALMELRERAALEALATIAPDSLHAIALGCTDARLGLSRLEKISRESAPGIAWLCANAKNAPGFLKASVKRGDLEVAAVLDPALVGTIDGCELVSPREGLAPLAKNGLVVLFHGDPAAAERELGDLAGISLIVCGHVERGARTRRLASGAALVTLEQNGQKLHALALDEKGLHAEAEHPLDGLLPDAAPAREALDAFYAAATELAPGLAKQKVVTEGGKFAGSASCRDCHKEAYQIWKRTTHSQALERLEAKDKKRAGLAECLVCHVTGFGFETGFSPKTRAPELAAVGCESCHGPGSNHIERAYSGGDATGYGRVNGKGPDRWRGRCMLCHDPVNSPAFELVPYLEKIRHWK